MKMKDFDRAFGRTPAHFTLGVQAALGRLAEKPVKRASFRLVWVTALILVLLVGVVYAAGQEWKILGFFAGRPQQVPQQIEEVINPTDGKQVFTVGDAVITIEETLADGQYTYITANVAGKADIPLYVISTDAMPSDRAADWDRSLDPNDSRTVHQVAQDTGRKLAHVTLAGGPEGVIQEEMREFKVLADGTTQLLMGGACVTQADQVETQLLIIYRTYDQEGRPLDADATVREVVMLTLPITHGNGTVQSTQAYPVEGTALIIEGIDLELTPMALHYTIRFRIDETQPTALQTLAREALMLEIIDEKGERLPDSMALSGSVESQDTVHYVQKGALGIAQIPDSLTLRAYDYSEKTRFGTVSIPLH